MHSPGPDELLAAYDAQLRARVPERLPPGETVERDGPLVRFSGGPGQGWVLYRDLGGLDSAELDALIARQVEFFRARGERFEWKYHSHDLPPDLPERLLAHGFGTEPTETVVIAPIEAIAGDPVLPDGVTLREVTARADFERIAEMEAAVWGDPHDWLPDMLESERAVDPNDLDIVVAEAGDVVVCSAWIRYAHGTEFAALFGARHCPPGGDAASTAPPSSTARTWPEKRASATSRPTPRTTATRSSSGSASSR